MQRQMSRDSEIAFDELHKRDRKIGIELAKNGDKASNDQLDEWLLRLVTEDDRSMLTQVESGHRLISFGMVILGLLLGWLTVVGLLQYDGTGRVNLVYLVIVFVFLQLAFLFFTSIAMLPSRVSRWLPGFSSFQEMLRWFSPGRLQSAISRLTPTGERTEIGLLLGRSRKIFASVGKWQLFSWSQLFGFAFNIAALLSLFILIAVKDIAFGWSSTLDLESNLIYKVTTLLSLPWQSWLPGEVPALSLIEASRYFRLQEAIPAGVDPELLGQWWRFLMLCLLFYGLLPRFFLMLFCREKLRRAINRTIRYFPGREALLDRLNQRVVETQAGEVESAPQSPNGQVERAAKESHSVGGSMITLVNWSGFELEEMNLLERLQKAGQFSVSTTYRAGTNCQLEEDLQVIQSLSKSAEPIGVLVKSWEPPLGELADFLGDLREAGKAERAIHLLPIALKGGELTVPEQRDIDEWKRFSESLVDPWLSVMSIATEGDNG